MASMATTNTGEDDVELEMDLDEDEPVKQFSASQLPSVEKSEEIKWKAQELDQKCKDIMDLLAQEKRRWDDSSGNLKVPVLEEYKKIGLTTRDLRDKTLPTSLHVLARYYERDYSKVPKHILKTVIRYLLEHRDKSSSETRPEENAQEQPILDVAMSFENDEFIDCVMDCWPHGFPDLLHISDSDGKNCLHHIFVLPPLSPIIKIQEISKRKKQSLKRGLKFVPQAKPETLAAKDKEGNTPIHYAMDYRQCFGRAKEYVEMFQNMVLKGDKAMEANGAFNNKDESPILYCQRTRKEYKAWQKEKQHQNHPPQTAPENQMREHSIKEPKPQPASQGPEDNLEEAKDSTLADARNMKPLPQDGGNEYAITNRNFHSSVDIPEGFGLRSSSISVHTSSVTPATKPDATPPNEHKAHPPTPPPPQVPNRSKDGEKPVNDILEFLRLHYIRTRSDLEARDLMDGKDASGEFRVEVH